MYNDFWIIPGIKMTNTCPFLRDGPSKIQFLLISDTLSVGGCWVQTLLLFWKLVDETQMSKPPEPTRNPSLRKFLILVPLRGSYFRSYHYETPCSFLDNTICVKYQYFKNLLIMSVLHKIPQYEHCLKLYLMC